jgi:hypothetical protein
VTAIAKKEGGVTFTVLEKALPFPIDPGAKSMLAMIPIEKDLNQELLSVSGLAEGGYVLQIDEAVAGHYTAKELAQGINLGFNEATPQFKQAQGVANLNEQRRNAEVQARSLLNTRRWMISHYKINVEDPAALQAHYDSFKDKKEYNAGMALNYIKNWPKYNDYLKQSAEFEQKALKSRKPVAHTYAIIPAGTEKK